MDIALIPEIHDWEVELLQSNGSSFLLCLYDKDSKKLVGSLIGERVTAVRFDRAPHLGFRLLRYIMDNEPHTCAICNDEKYEGWLWQQSLEYFMCTGCSQRN